MAASASASSACSGPTTPRSASRACKETIKGSKVELVDVRGDEIDQGRAKRNVEDVLAAMPDVSCLVGFYSYNTPRIYEVLKEAGKLGKIKIIGFDEDPITLGGVKEGSIVGTVVQQPFEWGYQGMKLMAKYLEGDKSGIPAERHHHRSRQGHRQVNVDDFMGDMKKMMGKWLDPRCTARAVRAACSSAVGSSIREAMPEPFLELVDISKIYPGVVALTTSACPCRAAR